MQSGLSQTSPTLLGRLRGDRSDPAAWEEFVQRYGGKIYAWCRQWQVQQADAEDVAQTVLLKLLEQFRTFRYDPSRSFRGWLHTVTYHVWCDLVERQQRPGAGSGDNQILEQLRTVEARKDLFDRLEEEFDREVLDEAMARVQLRVQPHTWEAFRLMAVEGMAGAEVARKLDIKVATVFVARSKVQKMLQDTIQKLNGPAK